MSINYKIVSIEGNIGSGKSTLLENIRNFYDNNTNVNDNFEGLTSGFLRRAWRERAYIWDF